MQDRHTKPAGWKQKLVHEVIEYWITFGYLAFFLVAVLAKVIMVGDLLRLGRGLEHKPLILPTLYRAVVFSVLVGVFHVLEATVRGLLHGQGLLGGFEEIASKGRYELLAGCVVMLVAFIPFFALKEVERVLGEGTLRALFWRRGTRGAHTSCGSPARGNRS